ncbi:UNVERIFIED_CONTAM: hypothetical protein HDU68_005861 [Siphonaria sp. JEL0065]|nr:hypothetical protein HDU68_005861 [Siphonaria sp. JEL0065]
MASTFVLTTGASLPVKEGSQEWFMVIDQEEGENLATSIVEGIVNRGQEVLFEKHIESQVLPYAVQFAKGTLLKIVQWQFFRRDSGEVASPTWGADEEPQPAVIDSWARGAIPIKKAGNPTTPCQKPNALQSSEDLITAPSTEYISAPRSAFESADTLLSSVGGGLAVAHSVGKVSSSNTSVVSRPSKVVSNSLAKVNATKSVRRGMSAHPPEEPEISAATAAERAIIEENKRVTVRIHGLECGGTKSDVGYDTDGRILLVKKAGASKLFTQGVKSKVLRDDTQSDNSVTTIPAPKRTLNEKDEGGVGKYNMNRLAGAGKLRTSRISEGTSVARTTGAVKFGESQGTMTSRATLNMMESSVSLMSIPTVSATIGNGSGMNGGFVPDTTLDIPALAETMRLAPGVTLREGDVVKKGPKLTKKVQDKAGEDSSIPSPQPPLQTRGSKPNVKRQISIPVGVMGVDPVLSTVLNKAKPSLRPIPFPALAVRGGSGRGGENGKSSNAYKKLPDIKAEEKRRVEAAQ